MTDKVNLFDMSVLILFAPALNHGLGICSAVTCVVMLLRVSDAVINRCTGKLSIKLTGSVPVA